MTMPVTLPILVGQQFIGVKPTNVTPQSIAVADRTRLYDAALMTQVAYSTNFAQNVSDQQRYSTPSPDEAFIANKDVGRVRPGQRAELKLEAYPFTDYGTVPGTLEWISRDAIQDEKLGLVYQARVRIDRQGLELARGEGIAVAPGMALGADVKTGKRSIIAYLLSPVARRAAEAGREQ